MSTVKKMAAVMMSAVLLASSAACGEFAKTHELSKQSFIDRNWRRKPRLLRLG